MLKGKKLYAVMGVIAILLAAGFAVSALRQRRPKTTLTYDEKQALILGSEFKSDLDRVALAPRYTLTATVDLQDDTVSGEMDLHYTNRSGERLRTLVFRLYPNADTIYGGGSLTIDRILQGGVPLDVIYAQDTTVAQVTLDSPLEPDRAATVTLAFTAQVPDSPARGYGIFAHTHGILSLAGWYPILAPYEAGKGWQTPPVPIVGDAMLSETSLYEVSLTAPSAHQVVATGKLLDEEIKENRTTWHFVSGPAREFAIALSDRFDTAQITVDGVTLRVHTLPASNAVTPPDEALKMASAIVSTYTGLYGPYRFKELDVVHTAVPIGGYEFPGMVYVEEAQRTTASRAEYEYLLAHELAHQWWYAQVGSHTVNAPWLDEGMATYSIALYRDRSALSTSSGDTLLQEWQRSYGTRGAYDPLVNSSASDFTGWDAYRQTIYIHGALFIDALRQEMGDNTFFPFLKDFTDTHRYQIVPTETFLNAAQVASDEDLTPLFAAWFDL
jgi:hypothetical protein